MLHNRSGFGIRDDIHRLLIHRLAIHDQSRRRMMKMGLCETTTAMYFSTLVQIRTEVVRESVVVYTLLADRYVFVMGNSNAICVVVKWPSSAFFDLHAAGLVLTLLGASRTCHGWA